MIEQNDKSILLVDDDEDDYVMFMDLLSQIKGQKFQLVWASSYALGIEKIQETKFDLCVVDYRLGVNTGLDFLKGATKLGIKTPIIMLTGYGEKEVDVGAMQLGAADYLVKDEVSPMLLERSIRYSLHRAESVAKILDREAQIIVQDRLASIGLLASSLAHEIGTPLGVIRGRAEFIEMQLHDNPTVRKNVDVIISQIDRVSKLIRSLLNLARGDKSSSIERVNFKNVAVEVIELMRHEFDRKEIRLEIDLAKLEGQYVAAQPGPLHQVLLNLLVNAVHAIESAKAKGKVDGHYIKIYGFDCNQEFCVAIKDSGCGISKENLKNLFKPFFTTKEIGSGTGLGLATSYRIVESWGGYIEVESEENHGADFCIVIPKWIAR